MNEQNNNPNPPPPVVNIHRGQDANRNRQVLFIVIIYLIFTMSEHIGRNTKSNFNNTFYPIITSEIATPNQKIITILSKFCQYDLIGHWENTGKGLNMLSENQGKVLLKVFHQGKMNETDYIFIFELYNGNYVDKGVVQIKISFKESEWKFQQVNKVTNAQTNTPIFMKHLFTKLFITQNFNHNVTVRKMGFKLGSDEVKNPIIQLNFESDSPLVDSNSEKEPNIEPYYSIKINMSNYNSRISDYILFSIILIGVSFCEFSSILNVLRQVVEGHQDPQNYSLLTMLIAMMWDCVLCLVAFTKAFETDENLVLFIIPGFIFCLLFTNLELRLMISIYRSHFQNQDIRQLLCRFNLLSYGCLLSIWPILRFTNLNSWLFIGISLIFVPQILVNGIRGHRPQITSPYYKKFLTVRFITIFYSRGFSGNIFDLEPDYLLCGICFILLLLQIITLFTQKVYGPKTVIPSFLLPPIYNYSCQFEINLQEGVQSECIICLSSLHQQVVNDSGQQIKYKIMKAPCNHIYHGSCLVKWMKIKMECPTCRHKLPPYQ